MFGLEKLRSSSIVVQWELCTIPILIGETLVRSLIILRSAFSVMERLCSRTRIFDSDVMIQHRNLFWILFTLKFSIFSSLKFQYFMYIFMYS